MRLLALIAALLVAAPAFAAAPAWTVNKPASKLGFTGAMSGQSFNGAFRRWDARIQFDPKALNQSSVVAVIETGSAVTGDQTRDEALPTADWFSVAAFPRATFQANQFKDLGGGRYQAIGTLTIRNVKRPVILPFQLTINGNQATMHGSLTIDRRAFGVGQGQFSTGDTVATNVRIDVAIAATRAP
ncbi:MAG: YceI family protein [Caulobacteraceae bacterium]|nr:YceI family protein [Caulobacteraceae bacterium]